MTTITLSPSQDKACDDFRKFLLTSNETEFILSGAAGTGKSFLVAYLLDLVQDEFELIRIMKQSARPYRFQYTATTNKAATVLSGMTGNSAARTIHSLLGLQIRNNYQTGTTFLVQGKDCENLNQTILIIDEASMISVELLEIIQKASRKYKNCKILYVGDNSQLPPVGETVSPVFRDTNKIHYLTEIQRQAAGSPIITLSHKYREILDNPETPWPTIESAGDAIVYHENATTWNAAIKAAYTQKHAPDELRILGWTNDQVISYNRWIRSLLGYVDEFSPGEVMMLNNAITMNDRLRARTDSVHMIDSVDPTTLDGLPGYNLVLKSHATGDYLKLFQPKDWAVARRSLAMIAKKCKNKELPWEEFFSRKNSWADLRSIYAQTVHKSQGSTYREVFVDVSDIGRNTKWYEVARLMYVAITRASHRVHFYGELAERYIRKDPMAIMKEFTDGTFKT